MHDDPNADRVRRFEQNVVERQFVVDAVAVGRDDSRGEVYPGKELVLYFGAYDERIFIGCAAGIASGHALGKSVGLAVADFGAKLGARNCKQRLKANVDFLSAARYATGGTVNAQLAVC